MELDTFWKEGGKNLGWKCLVGEKTLIYSYTFNFFFENVIYMFLEFTVAILHGNVHK